MISQTATEMSSDLWYELERMENSWYEIDTRTCRHLESTRMTRLAALVNLGLVRWWEISDGIHEFYAITERGRHALKLHRQN